MAEGRDGGMPSELGGGVEHVLAEEGPRLPDEGGPPANQLVVLGCGLVDPEEAEAEDEVEDDEGEEEERDKDVFANGGLLVVVLAIDHPIEPLHHIYYAVLVAGLVALPHVALWLSPFLREKSAEMSRLSWVGDPELDSSKREALLLYLLC